MDLLEILSGLTNYVQNERVASYNEGLDDGRRQERDRCAKIAENEIVGPQQDSANIVAKVILSYIKSGGTPQE